tara:strand:- start:1682 stop:1828 length:147 start_codon:yes stop_codon:yes gene_type:complete
MSREEKIEYIKKDVYLNEMWNADEIENVGELTDDELNEIIEEIKEYYK